MLSSIIDHQTVNVMDPLPANLSFLHKLFKAYRPDVLHAKNNLEYTTKMYLY